jgi:hypothetical protein
MQLAAAAAAAPPPPPSPPSPPPSCPFVSSNSVHAAQETQRLHQRNVLVIITEFLFYIILSIPKKFFFSVVCSAPP